MNKRRSDLLQRDRSCSQIVRSGELMGNGVLYDKNKMFRTTEKNELGLVSFVRTKKIITEVPKIFGCITSTDGEHFNLRRREVDARSVLSSAAEVRDFGLEVVAAVIWVAVAASGLHANAYASEDEAPIVRSIEIVAISLLLVRELL